jgi:hypothetical protein
MAACFSRKENSVILWVMERAVERMEAFSTSSDVKKILDRDPIEVKVAVSGDTAGEGTARPGEDPKVDQWKEWSPCAPKTNIQEPSGDEYMPRGTSWRCSTAGLKSSREHEHLTIELYVDSPKLLGNKRKHPHASGTIDERNLLRTSTDKDHLNYISCLVVPIHEADGRAKCL